MKYSRAAACYRILTGVVFLLVNVSLAFTQSLHNEKFVTYTANAQKQHIGFYWKDDKQQNLRSIQHLKQWLERRKTKLLFATNGGMYMQDRSPLGLFIANKKTLSRLNTKKGSGNFYLKPNGVFYITTGNNAVVCDTRVFVNKGDIKFAT